MPTEKYSFERYLNARIAFGASFSLLTARPESIYQFGDWSPDSLSCCCAIPG